MPDRIAENVLPEASAIDEADVRYPDPWLYMRSGQPAARWPFRGLFAYVGEARLWEFGRAQIVLRRAAVFFAGLAAALGVSASRGRAKKAPAAMAAESVNPGKQRAA